MDFAMLLICLAFWNFLRGEPEVGKGGRESVFGMYFIEGSVVMLLSTEDIKVYYNSGKNL